MEPRPLGGSSPPSLSRSLHRKWGKDAAATLRSSRSLVACLSPSARALQANCDKLSRAQQQFATLRHQPATMPGKTCLWARPSFPRMTQPRSFPPCGVFFDVHGSHQLARPRLLPLRFQRRAHVPRGVGFGRRSFIAGSGLLDDSLLRSKKRTVAHHR